MAMVDWINGPHSSCSHYTILQRQNVLLHPLTVGSDVKPAHFVTFLPWTSAVSQQLPIFLASRTREAAFIVPLINWSVINKPLVWCAMQGRPVILTLWGLRQEDHKFEIWAIKQVGVSKRKNKPLIVMSLRTCDLYVTNASKCNKNNSVTQM